MFNSYFSANQDTYSNSMLKMQILIVSFFNRLIWIASLIRGSISIYQDPYLMKQLMSNIRSFICPSNDALKFEFSITFFEGSQIEISKLYCISVSEDSCYLIFTASRLYPDGMPHSVAPHLGLYCLSKYPITWGFQYIRFAAYLPRCSNVLNGQ